MRHLLSIVPLILAAAVEAVVSPKVFIIAYVSMRPLVLADDLVHP